MTPLEELQAAHKRLSELRDRERVVPGVFHLAADASDEQYELMERWYANITEKVELLHRTIDAQLAILQEAIYEVQATAGLSGDFRVHELARAINGEA